VLLELVVVAEAWPWRLSWGSSAESWMSMLSRAPASSNSAATTFGLLWPRPARPPARCARRAQRLGRDQPLRRRADQALELGAADLEVAFRLGARGARRGQAALGLGHVRAGDLAHPEALAGGAELLGEHLLVVDVEPQQLLVADDVDVGLDGLLQHLLLRLQQARALRQHLVLGAARAGDGAAAAEHRLGDDDLVGGGAALDVNGVGRVLRLLEEGAPLHRIVALLERADAGVRHARRRR
jgi:hypothetical protein